MKTSLCLLVNTNKFAILLQNFFKETSLFVRWYVVHSKNVIVSFEVYYNWFNPLSANPTKWSNTLKQFAGKLATNCLSVFDDFLGLAFKGLSDKNRFIFRNRVDTRRHLDVSETLKRCRASTRIFKPFIHLTSIFFFYTTW